MRTPAVTNNANYRLWHQLTGLLLQFFQRDESGPFRMEVYEQFVLRFYERINPLNFVTIALAVSTQCETPQSTLEFLEQLIEKTKDWPGANVYAQIETAKANLYLGNTTKARKLMDDSERDLEQLNSVDTTIHAAFYRINADYYKAEADYTAYYKNALLYLACVDLDKVDMTEAQERAFDLSIAALLSDSIYNFGELLSHPILGLLSSSSEGWLRDLLFAMNTGDIFRFQTLFKNASRIPILEQSGNFLRQKICLTALVEAVFKRPPHERSLSFSIIANETGLPMEEVEHLVMKALSLKLVKGSIDQVDQTVQISWIQPRVLDMIQIKAMAKNIQDWDSHLIKVDDHIAQTWH